MLAFLIGITFLGLQYLAYKNIISIDYTALQNFANELAGQAAGTQSILTDLIVHAPFGASFVGGVYLGLQKG